jgi:hypothetical protein
MLRMSNCGFFEVPQTRQMKSSLEDMAHSFQWFGTGGWL